MHVFSSLFSHAAATEVFTWMHESLGCKLVLSFPRVAAVRCLRFLSFVVILSLVCVYAVSNETLYWQMHVASLLAPPDPKLAEAADVVAELVAARVRTRALLHMGSGLRGDVADLVYVQGLLRLSRRHEDLGAEPCRHVLGSERALGPFLMTQAILVTIPSWFVLHAPGR